ncbi:virulence factor MviN [Cellulomonas cellasea DSM 20118]|uniref:Virulence factor MviN n=1 Tax=Cellulomonas cellasea DSM 20118 TaxID=1408250 RepID=A0A0A0BA35_9CELL|nr:virulence factor MviN [Cellulomonas cellasea DSM 20118]
MGTAAGGSRPGRGHRRVSPRLRALVAGLAGAAAMIAVVTVLSRLLGFARTFALAGNVGADSVAGAYAAANTLPNVIFEVAAGGALAGALVPVLAGPLARGAREDVDRIASAVLGWVLLVLVPLGVLLALLAGPVARVVADLSDDPGQEDLVRFFVVVFAVQVPLYGVAVALAGVLQAQRRFFWPAFVPVLSSLVVLVAYFAYGALAGGEGTDPSAVPGAALGWLAWGTTAGVAAMSLPLLVPVWRSGVRLRPTLRFPEGVAAHVRRLAFAGVGALVAQQGAVLVVLALATAGPEGTPAVFLYVQAVYVLPYAVLAVPLATATFPRLAQRASEADRDGFARLAAQTTRAVLVASGLGAAALVAAAPAVASLFVGVADEGDPELLAAMSPALSWMAPGLLGYALLFHVSRALYALDRGRAAVRAAALGWLVVVVASLVACLLVVPDRQTPATLLALGAGNAVGMLVAGAALLVELRRAAGRDALHGVARTLLVLALGGVVGGVLGRLVADGVLALVGDGVVAGLTAGAGGGVVALVLAACVVLGLDRGILRSLDVRGAARSARTTNDGRGA